MADHSLLEMRSVSKAYPGPQPIPVLRNASLRIEVGESVAIVGPSGSGKSTILNLLGTLDRPDQGQILLEGRDLTEPSAAGLARIRNEQLGFIFQNHHLLPHCTTLENVLVPALAQADRVPASTEAHAKRLLERVGLADRMTHLPGRLSGGERQRCAVVRALINQPKLILADEPTGALDRHAAAEIGALLEELNRTEQVTLVVVTHSLELARRMQRTVELIDGQLNEAAPGKGAMSP